jgi:long-chain acyl-CoA synthetase
MQITYQEKPWLKSYPPEVPARIEIPSKSLNEFFDEATEKWRNRTAIIFYGKKISYKELREKVDRFACALSHLGVKKGDRVALLLLNSPEHIIAFFGVLKAGGIVTAISPVYVSPEIKHQLQDSGAETLICQDILYEGVEKAGVNIKNVILTDVTDSLPRLKKIFGKTILRDVYQKMPSPARSKLEQQGFYQFRDLIKKYPPDPPKVEINPNEDIVTLPYTGGTTGLPKGVMITHHNLIAHYEQFYALYPFIEEGKEIFVAYLPFYHAGGQVLALINGIIRGYTLVILTTPDLDDILKAVVKHEATFFSGTPALFELLKDYEKTGIVNWKRLKVVTSGADILHESTAKDWKDRTGVDLHDLYGLTELTCISHLSPFGKRKNGSIGIPVPNTVAAILDPDKDELLPTGEMGEIVVAGPLVAKGYWNNPEATKECEALVDGFKWWRTGDLGKMDEEGYFYVYDRKRDLIKYKGLRVYAREVEEVLKTHPKIKEVGVIGVSDIRVGQNVKALVVLEAEARGQISEEDIKEYCIGKLAPYKIPKIFEFIGEIPKTDVGKVSRRELREEKF